jgi:hypothetical protein
MATTSLFGFETDNAPETPLPQADVTESAYDPHQDPRQRILDFSRGFALMCDCGKPAHIPHCCSCGDGCTYPDDREHREADAARSHYGP